ncbi:MAG: phosphoglycerate kinase [Patescibacteria group bacterium]
MQSLTSASIKQGTRVFVRCDIDVPMEKGVIGETYRLDNLLETLKYVIEKGEIPLIAGHIGKPEGIFKEELSTKHLIPYFDEKLGKGTYKILENLRFDPREEQNDDNFAKELASKAEIYINESFATSHREHTSIVGITRYLPSYAGFRLQKEIETLNKIVTNPEKPLIIIIGGVKLESKLPVIEKFIQRADYILLNSILSANWSKEIPQNLILSDNNSIEPKDINTETIEKYKQILNNAKTILWAGPLGMYEKEEYITGTREIANKIVELTQEKGTFSVIGGGDTIAAVNKLGILDKFSFVSTGGGAMLQYLAEGTLPGIKALEL